MSDSGASRDAYVPLAQSHRTPRPGYADVGPIPADEQVRVVVKLKPAQALPDPDALGAIRPSERPRPATHREHADQYGAPQASVQAVVDFAHEHDLNVEEQNADARLVVLSGTADKMSDAFHTELREYRSTDSDTSYRGRTGTISVPADIAPLVTLVSGLDNRQQLRRSSSTWKLKDGSEITTYTPVELAGFYDFPPETTDAPRQTIALLEFGGGFADSDLDHYFGELQVRRPKVTARSVGSVSNSPGVNTDMDGEVTLDIEVAGGACPSADMVVYFADFTAAGWVESLTKAIHDPSHPSVVSVSWGWAEHEQAGTFGWTDQVMDEVNTTLQEAANLGITVIIASGDDGSIDGIVDGSVHADYPSTSPYVLSCGGTTITVDGGVISKEVVWNGGLRQNGWGTTGGGVSDHFPIPTWQMPASTSAKVPVAWSSHFAGRGFPDVAAVADMRSGYSIYVGGKDRPTGGTSAAAPLWAALLTRINEHLAAGGHAPVGYWNPVLYGSVGAGDAFRDVTDGDNDAQKNIGAYPAGDLWDACSGWGSPHGTKLLAAL